MRNAKHELPGAHFRKWDSNSRHLADRTFCWARQPAYGQPHSVRLVLAFLFRPLLDESKGGMCQLGGARVKFWFAPVGFQIAAKIYRKNNLLSSKELQVGKRSWHGIEVAERVELRASSNPSQRSDEPKLRETCAHSIKEGWYRNPASKENRPGLSRNLAQRSAGRF